MSKKQLIEEIIQTMPQISDNDKNKELKIALHIYTTIGRKKAFDEKYYFGDKKTRKQIEALANRSKTNTEEVAKNRKIVCISISNLYKDILKEFGIQSMVVQEFIGDNHVFPVVQLKDGRNIKADIQQDLHLIQTRSRLKNFGTHTECLKGKTDQIEQKDLTQLLIDIGYIQNEKDYRDEKIEELKKELQYADAKEALTKVLEDERICDIENELGYIEATKYYKEVLNQTIPQYLDKKIYRTTCYRKNQDNEKEYTLCLYAEEKNTIQPFLFLKRKNRFIRTNLEQLNQLEKEGLVIGDKKSRDGSKKLKKYMKKYRDGQEQPTTK